MNERQETEFVQESDWQREARGLLDDLVLAAFHLGWDLPRTTAELREHWGEEEIQVDSDEESPYA